MNERKPMDDYISRQAAKAALQEKVFHNLTDEFYGAMQVIDELPLADVVPVIHGMWEKIPYSFAGGYRCSCCGQKTMENFWLYCPNCGAKMDGERKE